MQRSQCEVALVRDKVPSKSDATTWGLRAKRQLPSFQALDNALAKLRRALECAPRELRQKSLQGLKPKVQAALLAFMDSGDCLVGRGAKAQKWPSTPVHCRASTGALICSGRLYRAQGFILNLRILTVQVQDRLQAKDFQQVLRLAREVALARASSGTLIDAELFKEAFRSACLKHNMDLEAMGLAFRAEVSGGPYVKRDIWGRYSLDVAQALQDRGKLLEAKAHGWLALRNAWIEVLQAPVLVRNSAPRGWARHRHHSAIEAETIVDMAAKASSTHRPLRKRQVTPVEEGCHEQRISRAARVLERKLIKQEVFVQKAVDAARRARHAKPARKRTCKVNSPTASGHSVRRGLPSGYCDPQRPLQRSCLRKSSSQSH